MTRNVLKISTSGDKRVLDLDTPIASSYTVLSGAVGGMIEAVDIRGFGMYVNEEGKIYGLPENKIATDLFDQTYGVGRDIIVGDVVITGGVDDEGEEVGLTPEQVENLLGDLIVLPAGQY